MSPEGMPSAVYALPGLEDLDFVQPGSLARYSQWGVAGDGCGGWSVKGSSYIANEHGIIAENMFRKGKVKLDRALGMKNNAG